MALLVAGFGVTLAQQSQAEVRFPGVVFKVVDEPKQVYHHGRGISQYRQDVGEL
jgi:hypothetical protein